MTKVHHTAVITTELETSLRFWNEGLGFEVLMEGDFDGDWPSLFGAETGRLHSVFLGAAAHQRSGPGRAAVHRHRPQRGRRGAHGRRLPVRPGVSGLW